MGTDARLRDALIGPRAQMPTPPTLCQCHSSVPCRGGGKPRIIASIEVPQINGRILAHLERTAPDQYSAGLPLGALAPPIQNGVAGGLRQEALGRMGIWRPAGGRARHPGDPVSPAVAHGVAGSGST